MNSISPDLLLVFFVIGMIFTICMLALALYNRNKSLSNLREFVGIFPRKNLEESYANILLKIAEELKKCRATQLKFFSEGYRSVEEFGPLAHDIHTPSEDEKLARASEFIGDLKIKEEDLRETLREILRIVRELMLRNPTVFSSTSVDWINPNDPNVADRIIDYYSNLKTIREG